MRNVLVVLIVFILYDCAANEPKRVKFTGLAQGTTYAITYYTKDGISYQPEIDSIFRKYDESVSIYLPNSIISRVNNNDSSVLVDDFFKMNFNTSMLISEKTDGAFDVTVAPLVNAWGFGFKNKSDIDSSFIDSLLEFVGYKLIYLKDNKVIKKDLRIMLDFNAIAQGYSVDVIAGFLESKGISDYLVEVGGEVKAKGRKPDGELWNVGIEKPDDNKGEKELKAFISLQNKALATSGNYKKFYIKNGIKYSHTINPKTGYPVNHSLLSASVFADDCLIADAYATSFMVMGLDKTKAFLAENKELDAYLIYSDESGNLKTYATKGVKKILEEQD